MQIHRALLPRGTCTTCPTVLLGLMNNALNRITFLSSHCTGLAVIESQEEWFERAGDTHAHTCIFSVLHDPQGQGPILVNTVPNQYYLNIYQQPYHESHLVH